MPSEQPKDGGPAFPHDNQELGDQHRIAQSGMTLRDYFAAAALQAIIAKFPPEETSTTGVEHEERMTAVGAYAYADAMLQERNK